MDPWTQTHKKKKLDNFSDRNLHNNPCEASTDINHHHIDNTSGTIPWYCYRDINVITSARVPWFEVRAASFAESPAPSSRSICRHRRGSAAAGWRGCRIFSGACELPLRRSSVSEVAPSVTLDPACTKRGGHIRVRCAEGGCRWWCIGIFGDR